VLDALPFANTQGLLMMPSVALLLSRPKARSPTRTESGLEIWRLTLSERQFRAGPRSDPQPLASGAKLRRDTNGLFAVTEAVYQIRGMTWPNMTIIEGKTGADHYSTPLLDTATAKAGLELTTQNRPQKPVSSSALQRYYLCRDHFGCVKA